MTTANSSKYFLVSGRQLGYYARKGGMSTGLLGVACHFHPPKNYKIATLPPDGNTRAKLHAAFIEPPQDPLFSPFDVSSLPDRFPKKREFVGRLLIEADDIEAAYEALCAVEGFFVLTTGSCVDIQPNAPRLLQFDEKPSPEWTIRKLCKEISKHNTFSFPISTSILNSGAYLNWEDLTSLGPYVEAIFSKRHLAESLNHLGTSRYLFDGYMSETSYRWYLSERMSYSAEVLREQFLHNRELYELAFLSAYKGIERIFDKDQISKRRRSMVSLLDACNFDGVTSNTLYRRRFGTSNDPPQMTPYADMIMEYLIQRNEGAGHANRSTSVERHVTIDSLHEIQCFLLVLCQKALGNVPIRPLPREAFLREIRSSRKSAKPKRG